MNKFICLFLTICSVVSAFSQNPISIERIINDLDWENCSESDVILTFKDNVVKRDKVEIWEGGAVSSFILKNVKVGDSVSDANIIVNKYNKKLLKIGGITLKDLDWSKGADMLSRELEDYFSTFWGREYTKKIKYNSYLEDKNIVYPEIDCEWGDSYSNDKASKGSFLLITKTKFIVIAIEPK